MPLDLPITLVAICDDAHDAMRDAIERTLAQVNPWQVLVFTDDPDKIEVKAKVEYHDFRGDYVAAMRCLWYEVPRHVTWSHLLWVQPDSWVLDAGRWTDDFLKYDYIGAPWPIVPGNDWHRLGYRVGSNVGNGGFSLRSRRLAVYLADRPDDYPLWLPEDDAICRVHRQRLKAEGFCWASWDVAARFSYEFSPPPPEGTFGFHGAANAQRLRA
jgi:Protein of unknown function (DUF5672)